MKTQAL